jgi:solute carrier family 20 (sodium-dependent phosphate transporter)
VFDPRAEHVFKYLQVFSACCVVFSHGAGEVGYMAGPLATVWAAYTEGKVSSSVVAPVWCTFIGAFGLVVGLATYGYNVTRAMGVRLSKLTATRGFCAELSTAFVIMIAAQYGLPTSSSQCITGGIIGVGLSEGKNGVNWQFLAVQFSSWIATLFVAGLCTAGLFAAGTAPPNLAASQNIIFYENSIGLLAQTMLTNYQTSLAQYKAAASAGVIPRITPAQFTAFNATLASLVAKTKAVPNTATIQPSDLMAWLTTALSVYQYDSVLTVGQVAVFPGAPLCNPADAAGISANNLVKCPAPNFLGSAFTPNWPPAA